MGWGDFRPTQKVVRRKGTLTGRLRYAIEYIRLDIRQYFSGTIISVGTG